MKKLNLFFAGILILSVANVNGQVFFGGNIGLTTSGGSTSLNGTSTDKTSTTSFTFSPMVGYFLSDNLAVGGQINFSSSTVKIPGNPEETEVLNTYFGTEEKNTLSNFSFGAGVNNIVTTGAITIGAIIKL